MDIELWFLRLFQLVADKIQCFGCGIGSVSVGGLTYLSRAVARGLSNSSQADDGSPFHSGVLP